MAGRGPTRPAAWMGVSIIDGLGVSIIDIDQESTREIFVGTRYQTRLGRHRLDGAVSTYPTPTALDFLGAGRRGDAASPMSRLSASPVGCRMSGFFKPLISPEG
jgi:hypothetical protein